MNSIKVTLTILAVFINVIAFAQGPPGGGRGGGQGGPPEGEKPDATEILKLLDTNNDDKIDKVEAVEDERGKIAKDFDEIDTNEDGFIDLEELEIELNREGPRKVTAKKLLKEVDQNEDGLLNELEVAAKDKRDLMDNFNEIDTNDDSQLDLDELEAFYSKDEDDNKKKNKKNR
ncbi:EF-hand domain-containing protein [Winogradskyella psychrotolerans]|uniref:EF-hand domain-containing protein n=1 Tax=Winogradskyella psychrotolerans TaxID=1344585 RepID=UPI001C06D676|nr:EF-hand domain-containing protein [Winogradskyella psychrotolerans]MBU2929687.1 EF-hand domain-containing protein [Winogradskyella psychrotolerans]